ncbi:MAG: NADPH-dependent FMN reductase [Flavobacteriales bacterium]|nr:NADPH-dependent FMN reductase [Flavobacteriales bacterium]
MITLISSTNRPDSYSESVSRALSSMLSQMGQANDVLSLTDLPSDFISTDLNGQRSDKVKSILDRYIQDVDKFIFVIPEYNGSYPGLLKTFLDGIPPKLWTDKKALIVGVSDGRAGNLRGQEQLTGVLHHLKMNVHYDKPKLSAVETLMNEARDSFDERTTSLLNRFLNHAIHF